MYHGVESGSVSKLVPRGGPPPGTIFYLSVYFIGPPKTLISLHKLFSLVSTDISCSGDTVGINTCVGAI